MSRSYLCPCWPVSGLVAEALSFNLDGPEVVSVEPIFGDEGPLTARFVNSSCDAAQRASCADERQAQLHTGQGLLLVEGRPGAEVVVLLKVGAGDVVPTCDAPAPLDLSQGRVTIDLSELSDAPSALGCGQSSYGEVV